MGLYGLYLLFTLLFPLAVVIGICYIIVKVAMRKQSSDKMTEKEGVDMLKHMYTYLVLFVTLMMSIGGSVGVFMGVANYVVPDPYVQSYETYRLSYDHDDYNYDGMNQGSSLIDEDEIRENYDRMVQDAQAREQRSALKLIIQSVGWIIIPLPVFLYFQKQLNESKDKQTV